MQDGEALRQPKRHPMIVISLVVQQGRSQRMDQKAVGRQPSNTGSCKRRGLSPDSLWQLVPTSELAMVMQLGQCG